MTLSVLFVCTANICRSPFMELWSRHYFAEADADVHVASAGTQGFRGQPMAEEMRPQLEEAGIDTAAFRSRRITREMVAAADLVLTAERTHRTVVLEDRPLAATKVLTLGQAMTAAERLPTSVRGEEGVLHLSRHRGSAVSELDVSDPYRRGADAADRSATTIVAMLARLLPVLG